MWTLVDVPPILMSHGGVKRVQKNDVERGVDVNRICCQNLESPGGIIIYLVSEETAFHIDG